MRKTLLAMFLFSILIQPVSRNAMGQDLKMLPTYLETKQQHISAFKTKTINKKIKQRIPFRIEWSSPYPFPLALAIYNPKHRLEKALFLPAGSNLNYYIGNWGDYKIAGVYNIILYNMTAKPRPVLPVFRAIFSGPNLSDTVSSELVAHYSVQPKKGNKPFTAKYNLKVRSRVKRQVLNLYSEKVFEEDRGIESPQKDNKGNDKPYVWVWKCIDKNNKRVPPAHYFMTLYAVDPNNPIIDDGREQNITVTP